MALGICRVISVALSRSLQGVSFFVARCSRGGLPDITVDVHQRNNDMSAPMNGDYVLYGPGDRSKAHSLGFIDPVNPPTVETGEKKIYARGSDGVEICRVYLRNDGTVEVANEAGTFEVAPSGKISMQNSAGYARLEANGTFVVNGVVIGTDGAITGTDIIVGGKSLTGHTHDVTDAPGETGPNN